MNDVKISPDTKSLLFEKHVEYISNYGKDKNEYEYHMTEFLRMSGIYWGVTALDLMGELDKIDRDTVVEFVKKCQCPVSGGIAACDGHDPHILYTLSAVQILCIYDCLSEIDTEAVVRYVGNLQQPDGSFFGDKWGEVDTRFSFCAVATLAILVSIFLPLYFNMSNPCSSEQAGHHRSPKSRGLCHVLQQSGWRFRFQAQCRESCWLSVLLCGLSLHHQPTSPPGM